MTHLSDRILSMEESATIAMSRISRELKQAGKDVISLSLGEPDFFTPEFIKDAAKEAMDQNFTMYTPVPGYDDLRESISLKFKRDNNLTYAKDQIVVSTGAKQSIANVVLSCINPGDEVIIPAPYWVSYVEIVKLAEGIPVVIEAGIETDFKVTPVQLQDAITDKTKMMIFSTPCNPTGSVYGYEELKALAEVIAKHPNIVVIADEIYEHINFTGDQTSMASLPGMFERTITVNGFAKGFAMTGWRVGYIAAPKWVADGCNKVQGQLTSANCSISQRGALAAITGDLAPTKKMVDEYHKRRDIVYNLLKDMPGVKANYPRGAFYFFPDVSSYYGKKDGDKVIKNGDDFCYYMLEKGHVSLVPGGAFGDEACVRLSYAASEKDLVEAMKRMKEALVNLK